MAAPTGDEERPLLAVALGQRLEAVERGLDETEAALRRLARCVPPEGLVWVAWAQMGLTRARDAVDELTGRTARGARPRDLPAVPAEGSREDERGNGIATLPEA